MAKKAIAACSGVPSKSAVLLFGGYKASGMGRELGIEAFESYTQTKSVYVDLN